MKVWNNNPYFQTNHRENKMKTLEELKKELDIAYNAYHEVDNFVFTLYSTYTDAYNAYHGILKQTNKPVKKNPLNYC